MVDCLVPTPADAAELRARIADDLDLTDPEADQYVFAPLRAGVSALPEDAATGSRDFGRGYAKAVRDVLELLGDGSR